MTKTVKLALLLSFVSITVSMIFVFFAAKKPFSQNTADAPSRLYSPFEIFESVIKSKPKTDSYSLTKNTQNAETKSQNSSTTDHLNYLQFEDELSRDKSPGGDLNHNAKVEIAKPAESSADLLWKLELLSEDYNSLSGADLKGADYSYLSDEGYIKTDFSYMPKQSREKNNNEKYAQEKLYINILAAILAYYQYPNDSSSAMKDFASFFDSRSETGKRQVLKEAEDYIKIAEVLRNTTGVPKKMQSINTRLANAYEKAGVKLKKLVQDMPDDERLRLTLDYNRAADEVARALISVSDMIEILNLSFDDNEPGKLFVFPGSKTSNY